MSIFVTGSTGYLGSYAIVALLKESDERLTLMVRAKDRAKATDKLWKALQLHMSGPEFLSYLPRIDFVQGDLSAQKLGIESETYKRITKEVHSVLHIAASLNRKSEKSCLNNNLRGTLSTIQLAQNLKKLKRFSFVSTVAVAGKRQGETLSEGRGCRLVEIRLRPLRTYQEIL